MITFKKISHPKYNFKNGCHVNVICNGNAYYKYGAEGYVTGSVKSKSGKIFIYVRFIEGEFEKNIKNNIWPVNKKYLLPC